MTALVTGSSRGLGRAFAEGLAGAGAVAILNGVDAERLERAAAEMRAAGAKEVVVCAGDVTDEDQVRAAVTAATGRFGRLLLELGPDDWPATFAVNVDALVHLCRAALPTMISAGQGAIVNTASQWGLSPAPGHVAYNASKAAVVSFTQSLARDYAPAGVRVNAVCPGEVWTPMLEGNLARSGRTKADLDALVPYGRVGYPEEVAALVAFLASDEAPYLCGAAVEITGAQAVA